MRSIRLSELAEQDLAAAVEFYESRRSTLGRRFIARFRDGLGAIRPMPAKFRILDGDLHIYTMSQFPYGIVYSFDADTIEIVAVLSFHRSPAYWSDRLRTL